MGLALVYPREYLDGKSIIDALREGGDSATKAIRYAQHDAYGKKNHYSQGVIMEMLYKTDTEREQPSIVETSSSEESPTIILEGERSGRVFEKGAQKGGGTHADVFSAISRGKEYAMKLPISPFTDFDMVLFMKEAGYHASFDHPHVTPVVLADITRDLERRSEVPFIVMPMAEAIVRTKNS